MTCWTFRQSWVVLSIVVCGLQQGSSADTPVANAGPNRTLRADLTVPIILDASASSDPSGHTLYYNWTSNGVSISTLKTAIVERAIGTHIFGLTVDDHLGGVSSTTLTVTVVKDPLVDWPQFYGPDGSGRSYETNWMENWPPVVAWRRPDVKGASSSGCSSPLISGGRVYYSAFPSGMWCLDAATGTTVWRQTACIGGNTTPYVDDDRVFTADESGSLYCLDKNTGAVLWWRYREAAVQGGEFGGMFVSPVAMGDIVLWRNTSTKYLIGLNKYNGAQLWSQNLTRKSLYYPTLASILPVIHTWNGRSWIFMPGSQYGSYFPNNGYGIDPITGANGPTCGGLPAGYGQIWANSDGVTFYGSNKTWGVKHITTLNGTSEEISGVSYQESFQKPIVVGEYGYYSTGSHGGGGAIAAVDLQARTQKWVSSKRWSCWAVYGDKLIANGGDTIGVIRTGGTSYVEDVPSFRFDPIPGGGWSLPALADKRIVTVGAQGLTALYTGYSAPVLNYGGGAIWNESAGTATLNGTLANTGGKTTQVYVYWGQTDCGTNAAAWEHSESLGTRAAGPFSVTVSPVRDSVYYYRCFATNEIGGVWVSLNESALTWDASRRFTTYTSGSTLNDESLIAHWTFEEMIGTTFPDVSGNGNHGTVIESVATTANGIMGRAAVMNWPYGMKIQSALLSETLNGDCALACWLYFPTNQDSGGGGMDLVSLSTGEIGQPAIGLTPAPLHFRVNDGGKGVSLVETGKWYHVAFTRVGTNLTLYVNGSDAGGRVATLVVDPLRYLRVLAPRGALVDDVRAYKRALSSEEIGQLYAMGDNVNGGRSTTNKVTVGSDDAEENVASGAMNLSRTDLHLGEGPGAEGAQRVGLRFPNAGIPQGASVLSATIQFRAGAAESSAACFLIRGQAADAPATFASGANNIGSRVLTAATAEWTPAGWTAGATGAAQQTPNLAGVLQEMVSRSGWTTNSAPVFVISGTGRRIAEAAEKSGGTSAVLRVVWEKRNDPLLPVSVISAGNANQVLLTFNRQVSEATAETAGNYQLDQGIAVLGATLLADGKTVRLATGGMATGATYTLTISNVSDLNTPAVKVAAGTQRTFVCQASPVAFVKTDTTTRGDWQTVYGSEGAIHASGYASTYQPTYGSVTPTRDGGDNWAWTTTDPRGLWKYENGDRTIASWNGITTNLVIDLNFTDGGMHQVAVYCVDWDSQSRAQRAEVFDPVSGQVWDTRTMGTGSFVNGTWLVWNVVGRQKIRFVNLNPATRAVVSGVFMGPCVATTPLPAAPSGLTATALTGSSIALAWTDNATDETGYSIERSLDGSVWSVVSVTGPNSSSYTDNGLTSGIHYYYRVASVNTGGQSSYATADATTPASIGSLAFGSASFSVTEGNSGTVNATITVTRTGGSSGAVSVQYATANGTATASSDYAVASGTLNWANGDSASKTFTVTVTGDTTVEGDETVSLALSNPIGGATLGSPSSATLTIINDDVEQIANGDWPQWRGPNRDGVGTGALAVTAWPPSVVWSNTLGKGESGMAISEGRLYTMATPSTTGMRTNIVYCFDASSGATLWTYAYQSGSGNGNYGPQATPTVCGNELYTLDEAGKLKCLNKVTGALLWDCSVSSMVRPTYGFAGSPLVEGNYVLLNASGSGVAVNRTTHAVEWPASSTGTGTYASPRMIEVGGQRLALIRTETGLSAVNPVTGATAWTYAYVAFGDVAADPVVVGDKILLYESGLVVLQATASSVSEVAPLNYDHMGAMYVTPVAVGDYAYAINMDGDLVRIAMTTGVVDWNTPVGSGGSLLMADDKLIVLGDGQMRVFKIGASGFDEEGRSAVAVTTSGSDISSYGWTPPIVWQGKVYCRVGRVLKCYQIGSNGANQAPTCSITSPANGATFVAPATVTINANASDSDGTVSRVEFYNGATKLGEDTTSPYSYTWNGVVAGTYSLTVNAVDNNSATTTSAAVSITVNAPQYGALAFSAATYSVTEGNSGTVNATITVNRTGGSDGAVSVQYATANGTATAGSDYTAASGTLNWASGDSVPKTFSVAVACDVVDEGNETVLLTLTGAAGGATLGSPSAATLTIVDDDASGTTIAYVAALMDTDGWRSTSVSKPAVMDPDADNVLGDDGYAVVHNGALSIALPSYISSITNASGYWYDVGAVLDNPTLPSSGTVANWDGDYLRVFAAGQYAFVTAFTVTVGASGDFVLTVISDTSSSTTREPSKIRIQQTAGGSAVAVAGNDGSPLTRNGTPDYYAFKIVNAKAGDVFTVSIANGDDPTENRLHGIAFEALAGGAPPAAPTGFMAAGISTSQIALVWTDNASGETAYVIQRSPNGSVWSHLTAKAANTTHHTDAGLATGTFYHYRVAASNPVGVSAWATASATTLSVLEQWRRNCFTAEELADPSVSGDGADPDCDGRNNYDEFIAGTDPKDATSVLSVTGGGGAGGHAFIIQWPSVTNRVYDLLRSSDLLDGFDLQIGTNLPATPPLNVYTDLNVGAAYQFYRVKVR